MKNFKKIAQFITQAVTKNDAYKWWHDTLSINQMKKYITVVGYTGDGALKSLDFFMEHKDAVFNLFKYLIDHKIYIKTDDYIIKYYEQAGIPLSQLKELK